MARGQLPHLAIPARPDLLAIESIERPPTWRPEPTRLTYLHTARDLDGPATHDLVMWALRHEIHHPRVITPSTLQWASLFHPRFHHAARQSPIASALDLAALEWRRPVPLAGLPALSRFWLESTLFLAGVTLSAAIVQSRWSSGTIGSKYDRLWRAGDLAGAGVAPELASLDLRAGVGRLARNPELPPLERLLALYDMFDQALTLLASSGAWGVGGEVVTMSATPLPSHLRSRFAFVEDLRRRTDDRLTAIIAYGSSTVGDDFADYDLVLVSDRPVDCLRALAGTSPAWRGKELNVGVYSPDQMIAMQRLSGDNLAEYGLCLYGEAQVVRKSTEQLLARNLSFGVVRQRQQLGMIASSMRGLARDPDDDLRNLYGYFVKIPANIAKGTLGAAGRKMPKSEIHRWIQDRTGFDTVAEQRRALGGDPGLALSVAASATSLVLAALNHTLGIVGPAPVPGGANRRSGHDTPNASTTRHPHPVAGRVC